MNLCGSLKLPDLCLIERQQHPGRTVRAICAEMLLACCSCTRIRFLRLVVAVQARIAIT